MERMMTDEWGMDEVWVRGMDMDMDMGMDMGDV
jgi:hypothetical protein